MGIKYVLNYQTWLAVYRNEFLNDASTWYFQNGLQPGVEGRE